MHKMTGYILNMNMNEICWCKLHIVVLVVSKIDFYLKKLRNTGASNNA